MIKQLFILSVLLVLVGCNTVGKSRRFTADPHSFFTYAVVDRDMRLIVVGDGGLPKAGLEQMITQELNANYAYLRPNFTTKPSSSALAPYKVVFAFNPPAHMVSDDICADPGAVDGVSRPGAILRIIAVFCEQNAMSEARVGFDQPKSLDDQNLRATISRLAWSLVPMDDPKDSNSE
jgi:hypothetical protein